jgi:hypothetical protein
MFGRVGALLALDQLIGWDFRAGETTARVRADGCQGMVGSVNHYAVPGNWTAIRQFRTQLTRHWLRWLRRRSQRGRRLTWAKMNEYVNRWLPPVRILHPFPNVPFAARTQGRSPVR